MDMILQEKEILKRIKKSATTSFVGVILIIVFGIVLFRNPENFLSVAISIFGYIAVALGVISVFLYFRVPESDRIYNKRLMTGIVLLAFGFVSFFENELLRNMITILLGGYLLILNAERVELAMFIKSKESKVWLILLSLAGINILASILLMIEPIPNISENAFVSIVLIIMEGIYSIQNLVILFGIRTNDSKKDKKKKEVHEIVKQEQD